MENFKLRERKANNQDGGERPSQGNRFLSIHIGRRLHSPALSTPSTACKPRPQRTRVGTVGIAELAFLQEEEEEEEEKKMQKKTLAHHALVAKRPSKDPVPLAPHTLTCPR